MKPRGRDHTSLTDTAELVVRSLKKLPGLKMIAAGVIDGRGGAPGGQRRITATYTTAGLELTITGQEVQKISVHTDASTNPKVIFKLLAASKSLRNFSFHERERKPGI